MSDPNSHPIDPKPERATEPTEPEQSSGDATQGEPTGPPPASAPTESTPQAGPAGAEAPEPVYEDTAASTPLPDDKQTHEYAMPRSDEGAAATRPNDAQTEAYPYSAAPATAPSQPPRDHAVTEAYTQASPTEHVLTGPEPTRANEAQQPTGVWAASPQYVDVPEAPKRKGNRWAGILIGIIQALVFAAAMFGVLVLLDALAGEPIDLIAILLSPALLIAVGMFFIGLVIVALLANRGGWWSWILGGLLIAAFAYVGWIGGLLVQEAATVPSNRVLEFVQGNLLTWPAVAAFILGREVPIWFGAWTAARGRKVAARNREARDDHERRLDEGDAAYR